MNDATNLPQATAPAKDNKSERTKQVTVVGFTVCIAAFFAFDALQSSPSWPVAFGVAVVAASVAAVCYFILKSEK